MPKLNTELKRLEALSAIYVGSNLSNSSKTEINSESRGTKPKERQRPINVTPHNTKKVLSGNPKIKLGPYMKLWIVIKINASKTIYLRLKY